MKSKFKAFIFVCCLLMVSVSTVVGVNAATKAFSFNFDKIALDGSQNGIFYSIGANKTVIAKGSYHLERTSQTSDLNVTIQDTVSISLMRQKAIFDEEYGFKSIGTASLPAGATSGSSVPFTLSWTTDVTSDKYYLKSEAYTKYVAKVGSGTLSW